jgi:hypothetical protein
VSQFCGNWWVSLFERGPSVFFIKNRKYRKRTILQFLKPKTMSHQKNQNCGTACCDCTVACKYHFIEDLCEQDAELSAHYLSTNKDLVVLCLIVTESMVGEVEIAFMQKVERLLITGVNKIRKWYFDVKKQKRGEKVLLNSEKTITILG